MKIEQTVKITPTSLALDERPRAGKETQDSAPQPRASVQLSPLSAQLKQIEASLESEQTVNTERVAAMKLAIAEGRFEVNAEKVADRLIDATREFLYAHKQ